MSENNTVEHDLRVHLRDREMQISNLNQQLSHQAHAIAIMRAEKVQLEGTIDAAQTQRDRLLECEADALANKYILDKARLYEIDELKQHIERLVADADPDAKKLQAMEADLNEGRTKFAKAHHDKLQAVKAVHDLETELNEITSALIWFAGVLSEARVNVVKRFQEHTSQDLTAGIIVTAYRASGSFDTTSTTLVDYLVGVFNKWKETQENESLINDVDKIV
jgi:chromosome segregation ATPase